MAFFEKLGEVAKNIGDKTTEVAKNIGDKTSEAIEIGKLNSKIKDENNAAAEQLKKIGEYYYKQFSESGACDEEIRELCEGIKAHYEAVAQAQADIEKIKTEKNVAPAAENVAPAEAPVAEAVPAPEAPVAEEAPAAEAPAAEQTSDAPEQPQAE